MMKGEKRMLVIQELAQGKELAEQLKTHLAAPSSLETKQILAKSILFCYEKAISLLSCHDVIGGAETSTFSFLCESPTSNVGGPCSTRGGLKKRKSTSMPCWTEEVRVASRSESGSGSASEGPPDDGYNWRKYGQKDILGSKFPRGYYRCSNRPTQGCLATKQVQMSNNNPTVLKVTYRGRHTCIQSFQSGDAPAKEEGNSSNPNGKLNQDLLIINQTQQIEFNFKSDHMVKKEMVEKRDNTFPSFSFTTNANPNGSDQIGESGNYNYALQGNNFLNFTPETPEPNYFLMSTMCHMSGFMTPDSGLTEIVSNPASVTNSPNMDMVFPLRNPDFESEFEFDDPIFFL